MKMRYKLLPVVLTLVLMLTACRDTKKDDLFRQEPGEKTLSQETDINDESTPIPTRVVQKEPIPTTAVITDAMPTEPVVPTEGSEPTVMAAVDAISRESEDHIDSQEDKQQDSQKNSQQNDQKDDQKDNQKDTQKDLQDGVQEDDNDRQLEETMVTLSENIEEAFYYEKLSDEIKARINGKSYAKDCTVPYSDLRYVRVLHYGFDGEVHEGELIVNKAIAEDIVEIFQELYEIKYPIEKMVLVDEYDADDNASMADNNTSAFNYRVVEGTDRISMHGYGLAIDINPLYNPYVHTIKGKKVITPVNGARYADRSLDCEYYIKKGDALYNAFIKRGFTWGGAWKNSKDYQHFQKEPE